MQISMHIGAQRCAVAKLREYLLAQGALVWGPEHHCAGLSSGVIGQLRAERVRADLMQREQAGTRHLILADAGILGSSAGCLLQQRLFGDVRARLTALRAVLGDRPLRIGITVRDYVSFWGSALVQLAGQGACAPDTDSLDRLVTQPRRWRDVICDVAAACPDATIAVWTQERLGARPDLQAQALTGQVWPQAACAPQMQAAPQPFDPYQSDVLLAQYFDDLAWLRAGADGLADFYEGRATDPAATPMTRGCNHDDGPTERLG